RMQSGGRMPGAVADAADALGAPAGRLQRHTPAVAGDDVASLGQSVDPHLHALDGRIDVARRALGADLFTEHVPGLQRHTQLELDGANARRAIARKTELEERCEPIELHRVAMPLQIANDLA